MKITKNLGMVLLSIWLIATGLFSIFNIQFEGKEIIMAILAIASGVFFLFDR